MKTKGWIKSPWIISIGTAIFSLFLTMGYDFLKNIPVLSTLLNILKAITNFIILILNFNLKVWWLLISVIVFIGVIYLIDKFKQEETFKPDFYDFREGKFKKWRWTWSWEWNQSKKAWIISDLKAYCPKCDTPMIQRVSIYELRFDCPRCDFIATNDQCDEPHKIERLIHDNIDRNKINKNI